MALKRRFTESSEALDALSADDERADTLPRRAPSTGPGQMLAFQDQIHASNEEIETLRARLVEFEKALRVAPLDPGSIKVSRLGNRHEASFSTAEFTALKVDIAASGGNVQPIKVRPLDSQSGEYELVFGHRRHRACLELGLPVLAMIESVDDQAQFLAMDRENRARADLSPYEQGMHYRRALDLGIFPSLRQLATAIGISHAAVSKAVALAELPEQVIAAFRSPLEIQFRWGTDLAKALKEDSAGVLQRAAEMNGRESKPSGVVVKEYLQGIEHSQAEVKTEKIGKGGQVTVVQRGGAVSIAFKPGVLNAKKLAQLTKTLESLIKE